MAEQMDAPSEAMLATLTPEEREAYLSDELTPGDRATLQAIADDGEDDDGDDGDDSGEDATAPAGAEATVESPAKPAIVPDAAGGDEAVIHAAPRFRAKLPEDFPAQVELLNQERARLAEQFKSGELEFDAYHVASAALADKRAELLAQATKVETIQSLNSQTLEQEWEAAIDKITRQAKAADGIDYATDAEKLSDLDMFVKRLGQDEKNATKNFDWFIAEAHKRVKALHGIVDKPVTASAAADPKAAVKAATAARKPQLAAVPATLANVPGGDGPGDVADEFAPLDALEGVEYEQALARLTPAQREKYMQAA